MSASSVVYIGGVWQNTKNTHMGLLVVVVLILVVVVGSSNGDDDVFSVVDYGAVSDGATDDSEAFLGAWSEACSSSGLNPTVMVPPERTFLVYPTTFVGPCLAASISFTISGTIIAPNSPRIWHWRAASEWIVFKNVQGLTLNGFGFIDGSGKSWWDQSCRYHPKLVNCTKVAPTVSLSVMSVSAVKQALKFASCDGGSLEDLQVMNSAQTHVSVTGSRGFKIENVDIKSPGNSPNTDGIHIHASHDIIILNSRIASGDDCISIGDYLSDVQVSNIACGPGHGISIGSLGKSGNYVRVEKIHVKNSLFNGTTNGARIKTWQVGRGYVRDVRFENLVFHNIQNPIIIDQSYCDVRNACKEEASGVEISNVIYKDLYGTSSTKVAVNLNCSRSVPCSGILMDSIHLKSTKVGQKLTAECTNAYGRQTDAVPHVSCLLP